MINKTAHIFSWVLSPVLIPTYAVFIALWVTTLSFLPAALRWNVVVMVWLITCMLPMLAIYVLYKLKIISHPGLNNRKERYIPYMVTAACYLGASWYLHGIHAPHWMWMFMVGGAVAAVLSCVVNIWWKISAHAAAMGGLLALLSRIALYGINVIDMWPVLSLAIILTGILCTSRILLQCHTLMQVAAGVVNGFFWVFILT
ncbi:MAG: hypothetical protein K1V87_02585 [Muribaculum sp.]